MVWVVPLLFLFSSLFGVDSLYVQLDVQDSLFATFVTTPLQVSSHEKALLNVLKFDLENNGRMSLEPENEKKQQLALKNQYHENAWSLTRFIINPHFSNNSFSLSCFDRKTGAQKVLEPKTLSGDLSRDRRLIHHYHDTLFYSLFKEKGIASKKFLFTIKKPHPTTPDEWIAEVYEADYDGKNKRALTNETALCVTPSFLPLVEGGKTPFFFYVSYKLGQPKIFLGSNQTPLNKRCSLLRGNQLMPVLSPKGDCVAFISDIAGNPDLFIQPFSKEKGFVDKPRQIFTAPKATQGSPCFSPDGKTLAFVSNKDGPTRIYTLSIPPANSSLKELQPRLITKKNRSNTAPAWSPDGQKLAYSSMTKGVRQIWIYDFLSGQEEQLTYGNEHKENPAWAPDSCHLLYNSSGHHKGEIYLINLRAKKPVKVSQGPGEKRFPTWEPST